MPKTISVKDAALWKLTERKVSALCKNEKIKGAKKNCLKWIIPADTAKPAENRIKSGTYILNVFSRCLFDLLINHKIGYRG